MPIARRPFPQTALTYKDVVADSGYTDLPAGAAVSVVWQSGSAVYRLAGACLVDHANTFCGFVSYYCESGQAAAITTLRGAIVTPLLEGGEPLVPDQSVFLSLTPGKVTQTVPIAARSQIIRVGFAINATQFMLNMDAKIENP